MQVTNTYSKPTEKQLKFAESLARRAGYSYLSQAEKAHFGKCRVGGMNRAQVSELIDALKG